MADTDPMPNLDDLSLLIAAEARIDSALPQIILATEGVSNQPLPKNRHQRVARGAVGHQGAEGKGWREVVLTPALD